jgi:hypothetical protein
MVSIALLAKKEVWPEYFREVAEELDVSAERYMLDRQLAGPRQGPEDVFLTADSCANRPE